MTLNRSLAAAFGNLEKDLAKELARAEKSVKLAITEAAKDLKDELRAEIITAGLGKKLARAWRHEVFPKGKPSTSAAATVFSKAERLHAFFDENQTIKSKDGFWLAIPTENAPKRGVDRSRITPSNFPEARLGKLRFVMLRGRKNLGLLVVDKLRRSKGKRGGFRKASKTAIRKGEVENSVAMFWLVPSVSIKKRTDFRIDQRAAKHLARVPGLIADEMDRLDQRDAQ